MYLEPDVNIRDNISKTTEWRWGIEIGYLHNISLTSSTPCRQCNNESPQTDFDNRFDSDTESVELNDIDNIGINNRENYNETEDTHEELMFPQAGLTQKTV
ncbi:hypothetical protein FQA39_LY10921 [Lamprigera yunnana]|nr:hypothetical protein FQA39_LY10921 [Lamprigera yunnana]